ncbi:MAG: glycosyltransferase family 4 protein [Gammaproteobacteria bacterium]|nr:glycosyltransferase family 4 protein [Gammaproteobacteria bacterium]
MNVLYICQDYGIPVLGSKGSSVHVREMIAALHRAGHAVALLAPATTGTVWAEPARVDAQFLHIPAGEEALDSVQAVEAYCAELEIDSDLARDVRRILYDRYLQAKLLRKFSKSPPDFIYARAALHSVAPVALAQQTGRPLLVELNAPLVAENVAYRAGGNVKLASAAERKLLCAAAAVLAVSKPLAEHAIACGVNPERVHVVANAVDPRVFFPAPRDPDYRADLGLGDGPVLGFVGGLRQWHGVEILPELLRRLVSRFPTAQLVIAGSGPLETSLRQSLAKLGLGNHALFTGALEHGSVARLIREFDIALAPYPQLDHSFYFSPLKLFEYMACGGAVVAADVGQISEVVDHGATGLLYPAGNLDELVGRCEAILLDPSLQQALGAKAASEILANFTWDQNAARVIEIARASGDKS